MMLILNSKEVMERRAVKREHTKVKVRFPCFGTFLAGTVTDVSENGMFINTSVCFPPGSPFEILIHSKKEVLKIPFRVSRTAKTGNSYNGMGVELLSMPRGYLELLIRLTL